MTQNRDHNDHVLFPDINFRPTTPKSRIGQNTPLTPKRKPRFRWIFLIILGGIVFGGSLTIAWYSYMRGYDKASDEFAPHISGDETPFKTKPDEPGGMKIPHRDRQVYDMIAPPENREFKVENLLAEPEKPSLALIEETNPIELTHSNIDSLEQEPQEKEKIVELIETTPLKPDLSPQEPKEQESQKESLEEQLAKILPETKEPEIVLDIKKEIQQKIEPRLIEENQIVKSTSALPAESSPKIPFRVQLGAVKTSQEAQKEINRLKKLYPEIFKNCELIAKNVDLGTKGIFYRIQTTNMSKEDAEKTVEILKKMKQACFVVKP